MRFSMANHVERRQDSGQVLVLFVLSVIVLILFIGLGVDLGFSYITQAQLSKAVDAAALTAARNISLGTNTATQVALNAFANNYGVSSRDVTDPKVVVQIFSDANNNEVVSINATVSINTFFIRVLPQWATLTVASSAQATRDNVIMTLVLDTSGSMAPRHGAPPGGDGTGSGGGQFLPGAVTAFVNNFDENHDKAAMVSFNTIQSNVFYGGFPSQPISPFQQPIIDAVNAFVWTNATFSQGGLTNALILENNATIPAGQAVAKVVVFCTDGFANVVQGTFDCPPETVINFGGQDINSEGVGVVDDGCGFYDPTTGIILPGDNNGKCFLDEGGSPSCCPGVSGFQSANNGMQPFLRANVSADATVRAIQVANQMRANGIIVYSIGVGGSIDPVFLAQIANDPSSPNYVATSFDGEFVVANDPSTLGAVFQTIASKILLRLSK